MPMNRAGAAALLGALALAACSDDSGPDDPAGEGAAPAGEVLEGSISDAMIPLDQLRSQPPRAAPLPGEANGAGSADGTGNEAGPAPAAGVTESEPDDAGTRPPAEPDSVAETAAP